MRYEGEEINLQKEDYVQGMSGILDDEMQMVMYVLVVFVTLVGSYISWVSDNCIHGEFAELFCFSTIGFKELKITTLRVLCDTISERIAYPNHWW